MKYLFLEEKYNYSNYNFPYKVYLEREEEKETNEIFESGFLPTRIRNNLFYLCRSSRVNLNKFETSSENRRILRKTDYLTTELIDLKDFNYNYKLGKQAIDFYKKRFGEKVFSAQKIKWIFTGNFFNGLLIFKKSKEILGYCPIMKTKKLIHYAYPFYKLDYFDKNIGMGMMTRTIKHAKDNNFDYVYLGTCYTKSALYKLQFEGQEFFDGKKWNTNIDLLKKRVRAKKTIQNEI